MADSLETRTVTATVEIRQDGDAPTIVGHAATFNEPYQVSFFNERIHPDAFKRTLANNPDVRLLINHRDLPLARTKSGTLTLGTDAHGLTVEARLDPTDPDVQRLLPKMERGDLDQMSFGFRVPSGGDSWDYSGTMPMRTVREASLSGGDVSIVTYPANEGATVAVRERETREAAYTLVLAYLEEIRAGRPVDTQRLNDALDSMSETPTSAPELYRFLGVDTGASGGTGGTGVVAPPAEPPRTLPHELARRLAEADALRAHKAS